MSQRNANAQQEKRNHGPYIPDPDGVFIVNTRYFDSHERGFSNKGKPPKTVKKDHSRHHGRRRH